MAMVCVVMWMHIQALYDNVDTDSDGLADGCDTCPNDDANDADGDGVCGDVDLCNMMIV